MSSLDTPLTSPKRTFRVPVSSQNWRERVGDLVLAAGVFMATAACFIGRLEWWQTALVCAACLIPSLLLMRMDWLKLFGPVLYYDMVRQARRSRFAALRFIYLLLLACLLANVVASSFETYPFSFETYPLMTETRGYRRESIIAQRYFDVFMLAQLITVVLITPAYVAGAIAEEKDRRTLEYVLTTDLRNREIVLGKLASRLANMGLLVITGLPILSILQFLGGVDPNLVFAGFAVTGMTMASLASVSILCSVLCEKPRGAIVSTYLVIILYYALSLIPKGLEAIRFHLPIVADAINLYNCGDPISFIAAVREAGGSGALATALPYLVWQYALYHALIALLCLALAIRRVRSISVAQLFGKTATALRPWRLGKRPPIGSLPVLWKEIYCEGSIRSRVVGIIFVDLLVVLTFAAAGKIIVESWLHFSEPLNYRIFMSRMTNWLHISNTVLGCMMMMAIAIRASTTLTREREKQTLEVLLTTPLASSWIVGAKWAGSILSLRLGFLWIVLIWAVGIVTGALTVSALALVIVAWLVFASFAASLGMWFSSICRSTMRATMGTILAMFFLWGGHWLIWLPYFPEFTSDTFLWKRAQAGILTPPFAMSYFASSDATFIDGWDGIGWIPQSWTFFRDPWPSLWWDRGDTALVFVIGLSFWATAAFVLFLSTHLQRRKGRVRKRRGKMVSG